MVHPPMFSVVVPSHGRPGPLSAALRAILESDFPRDQFEVLVVDDGSPGPVRPPPADAGRRTGRRALAATCPRTSARPGRATRARAPHAEATSRSSMTIVLPIGRGSRAWKRRSRPTPGPPSEAASSAAAEATCTAPPTRRFWTWCTPTTTPSLPGRGSLGTANLAVPADAFRDIGGFDPCVPHVRRSRILRPLAGRAAGVWCTRPTPLRSTRRRAASAGSGAAMLRSAKARTCSEAGTPGRRTTGSASSRRASTVASSSPRSPPGRAQGPRPSQA